MNRPFTEDEIDRLCVIFGTVAFIGVPWVLFLIYHITK